MKLPAAARRLVLVAGLCLLVLFAVAFLLRGSGEARGSTISRGSGGWIAARQYLAQRGAEVVLLSGPLESFEGTGTLVVSFPWQRGLGADASDPLEAHLRRGGDLVLAYSGVQSNQAERVVLTELGFELEEVRPADLNLFRWRRFTREEWTLRPSGSGAGGESTRIWAPRFMPELPEDAKALYQTPEGRPVVAWLPRHRGKIWFLPTDALANSRLSTAGNADLLETLYQQLGRRWTFDEYHHGLADPRAVETEELGRILDLVLIHLAVLYLAAVLTLARRFGPAWSEPPVTTGSVGSFLRGLGALHHRLGHHRDAARLLLARSRDLDGDLHLPAELDRRAETAGPQELVALGGEVARLRRAAR